MQVEIPKIAEHAGIPTNVIVVNISDECPVCGGKRGTPEKGFSGDGSRKLWVDCWKNPCGHIDSYASIREEHHKLQHHE